MGHDALLERPGLAGPFGALMDEYARAAVDFLHVLEAFDGTRFGSEKAKNDEDTRTPRLVAYHVVSCARRYADYIRKARGLPFEERYVGDPAEYRVPADTRPRLRAALRYTEGALEGFYDADDAALEAASFHVRWGPRYDPEMLLEHAVCHLLRHRRQLERW
jgi:hypothetical protein